MLASRGFYLGCFRCPDAGSVSPPALRFAAGRRASVIQASSVSYLEVSSSYEARAAAVRISAGSRSSVFSRVVCIDDQTQHYLGRSG